MTSNLSGNTFSTTDANGNGIGFYVTPNKNCQITAVVKSSTTNATTAYVYDSSKSLLTSASFSGDTATFSSPLSVTNASNYYVITRGHSTRHYQTALSYTRARTDLTYTNNAYMTTTGDVPSSLVTGIGEDANILDIQTQVDSTSNFFF